MVGLSVPEPLRRTASRCRYNPCVFIAPPWSGIYTTDAERRQDYSEAKRTYEVLAQAYRDAGYMVVALPLAGVNRRAEFLRDRMRRAENAGTRTARTRRRAAKS
jgi:predicted ATPase